MHRGLVILGMVGCSATSSPWPALVDREAVWWDAPQLRAEVGRTLTPVQHGLPVGYWPRVTLRPEGLDFDNRAWLLSLPQNVYDSLLDEEIAALLVERTGLPSAPPHGDLLPALAEAASDHADIHQSLADRFDTPDLGDGAVVLVPAPDVPVIALVRAIYSVGQGRLGAYALAGVEDGHLRLINATGPDTDDCALSATLFLTPTSPRIVLSGQVPPLAAPGCGAAEPTALIGALSELVGRCTSRWQAIPAVVPCASLITAVDGGTASTLFSALSTVQAASPAVQHRLLANTTQNDVDALDCSSVLTVAALTDAQLDVVCDGAYLRTAPTLRGGLVRLDNLCTSDATRAAFPEWSARQPSCSELFTEDLRLPAGLDELHSP